VCVCVFITVCESDLGLQVPGRFIGDPAALSIRLSVCKSAGLVLLCTQFLSRESDCLICVLWLVFTAIRRLADALTCSINATGEYRLDLLVLTARCIRVRDLKTLSSVKVLKLSVCVCVLSCSIMLPVLEDYLITDSKLHDKHCSYYHNPLHYR